MLSQVITLPSFPLTAEVKLDIKHTRASEFCLWEERGEHHVNPVNIFRERLGDWPGSEVLGWQVWPRQEGDCRIPRRRKAAHEKFVCHGAHGTGAEEILPGQFGSCSGLMASILEPRVGAGQHSLA